MTEIEVPDILVAIQSIDNVTATLIADAAMWDIQITKPEGIEDEIWQVTAGRLSQITASDVEQGQLLHSGKHSD